MARQQATFHNITDDQLHNIAETKYCFAVKFPELIEDMPKFDFFINIGLTLARVINIFKNPIYLLLIFCEPLSL